MISGILLDLLDAIDSPFQGRRHEFVHLFRLVPLDKDGRPAAAAEKLVQLLRLNAGENGRIADLVTVEMEDRQHGPVRNGIEHLVGLPCRGQRTRFRFPVADDAGHN